MSLKIIIDNRELRTPTVRKLYDLGVDIEVKHLPVADFIVSDRVGVEKKTSNDLNSSIIDSRLFQQAEDLKNNFERPVILIEGNSLFNGRLHPNSVRGAIASLMIDFGIPVIMTDNGEETAFFLVALAKREQEEHKRKVLYNAQRKPLDEIKLKEHIIASLPNVGGQLAKNLLEHFRTIEKVFTASEEDLTEVEGIGEIKAKRIRDLVTKEYEDKVH